MNTALHEVEKWGARLTVGIEGSFGVLHYAVLAFAADRRATGKLSNGEQWPLLTEDLRGRGFRPARTPGLEDIVLKAQPSNGSIQCWASTEGLISLLVDKTLVWSRQFDPEDPENALWLTAALTTGVTLISGDYLRISETKVDQAASMDPLVMAKVPTVWTR